MNGEVKWYRARSEEAFSLLESNKEGLSEDEASFRLSTYGYNEVMAAAIIPFSLKDKAC